eukprot:TRINITY_DN39990_c0_g1_i1.p1 TRINITY_DN39990_c0_g1~~TRINITY_DN39990_c0_g1_i1.p1  ORF type:complete len:481 (-),score=76.18 TRINITY_DN39990_c0_g1_i1:188-1630(-)
MESGSNGMFVPQLDDVLMLGGFLMSVYAGSKAVSLLRGPSLLGEIGIGIVWLGCGALPSYLSNALQIVGSIGLLLMVFDGGVHMDLNELRKQGVRAFFLALLGLILPIVTVFAVMLLLGYAMQESVACGIVLSSTAIGFTLQLMNDAGLLNKPMGQLIASAAMIDDVMSIIALAVLNVIGLSNEAGTNHVWSLARPAVMSVVVCVVVLLFRAMLIMAGQVVKLHRFRKQQDQQAANEDVESETSEEDVESQLPQEQIESRTSGMGSQPGPELQNASPRSEDTQNKSLVSDSENEAEVAQQVSSMQNRIRIAIFVAAGFGLLLSWVAEELHSTYLLGVFMAGMLGTAWSPFAEEWHTQTELLVSWLSRIFFACTVGFQVPLQAMTSSRPWDVILVTLAAVIGKFVSGIGAASPCSRKGLAKCVQVGSAMVGRGEIGFVVATQTYQLGLVTVQGYSATVWALLLATILGPIMFQLSLKLGTQ